MQPKIVARDAFHVVGIEERYEIPNVEGIPAQWDRFNRRRGEIADAIAGASYGVCIDDSAAGKRAIRYVACVAVRTPGGTPQGMTAVDVPAGRYAVFTHHGLITTFGATVRKIWQEWIPASGLRPTGAPDFELYDHRFTMDERCAVDVYVPVEA